METDSHLDLKKSQQERLALSLQQLAEQGETQQSVAKRLGVPAQYLSDVKAGRRTLTELFARRFAAEFAVDYQWLLGKKASPQPVKPPISEAAGAVITLPVLPQPIDGDPYQHDSWDGSVLQICGPAAVKAQTALRPYILRLGSADHAGRLSAGDLLLVSQAHNANAPVQIVRQRGKIVLARGDHAGQWLQLTTGNPLAGSAEPIGHLVAIVWAVL